MHLHYTPHPHPEIYDLINGLYHIFLGAPDTVGMTKEFQNNPDLVAPDTTGYLTTTQLNMAQLFATRLDQLHEYKAKNGYDTSNGAITARMLELNNEGFFYHKKVRQIMMNGGI